MRNVLLSLSLTLLFIEIAHGQDNQFRIRAWQFHDYNVKYIEKAIQLAPKYNVNTVVFSHDIVWYTETLFYDHYKARFINLWAQEAHKLGMKAWIWTHELSDVPRRFLTGPPAKPHAEFFHEWIGQMDSDFIAPAKADIDKPGFWRWVANKYTKLFTIVPEVDGMILTLDETPWRIFANDAVESKLSKPERIAKLVSVIDSVCKKFHKTLVVRSFGVEPRDLNWLYKGLEMCPRDVIIMTKTVPHDWDPYYPNSPLLGVFKHHKQILEVGTNAENGGMNYIPYPEVSHLRMRLEYARSKGVVGYVARMGTQDHHDLGTPNSIDLYAMDLYTEDPSITADSVWRKWAVTTYGKKAAPYMIRALRPAFNGVNKMFFFLGMWLTNHSKIPTYEYAKQHISFLSPAQWWVGNTRHSLLEKKHYSLLEEEMNHPGPRILEKVLAEKDDAIRIQAACETELDSAKEFLPSQEYLKLKRRFEIWRYDAQTWRDFADVFFSYRIFEKTHDQDMLLRASRSLADLSDWAKLTVKRFGPDVMEENPARTMEFVSEMRRKISLAKRNISPNP